MCLLRSRGEITKSNYTPYRAQLYCSCNSNGLRRILYVYIRDRVGKALAAGGLRVVMTPAHTSPPARCSAKHHDIITHSCRLRRVSRLPNYPRGEIAKRYSPPRDTFTRTKILPRHVNFVFFFFCIQTEGIR